MNRYAHRAMAAPFEIILPGIEKTRGAQIAQSCFNQIDEIETEISRWNPSSETGLINNLNKGESTMVGDHCFRCLEISGRMYKATGKLFDVTIGPLLHCWLTKDYQPRNPSTEELARARAATGFHRLKLNPKNQTVTVLTDGLQLDFGGIGKGYALDQVAHTLREDFERTHFLLNAGDSTVYAEGPDWQTGAGGQKIPLHKRALSGSSVTVKGHHIINPHTGHPVGTGIERGWALAPTAAESDALSTALMLMNVAQIEACGTRRSDFGMKVRDAKGRDRSFGNWPIAGHAGNKLPEGGGDKSQHSGSGLR